MVVGAAGGGMPIETAMWKTAGISRQGKRSRGRWSRH